MSELLLSILRIGFLFALWWFVLTVVSVLRRDLQAPRDAKPLTPERAPQRPSPRATLRVRKTSTQLIIVEGALSGTIVPLGTSPIVIGRAPDATIVLDDDFVSTHHARLTPNGNHWIVEDLGSTNGTWIDKNRVSTPTVFRPGTQLRIGKTSMELSS
jgi:pSer/pThr/pTyr-binding forkhead associated (FHA) protein